MGCRPGNLEIELHVFCTNLSNWGITNKTLMLSLMTMTLKCLKNADYYKFLEVERTTLSSNREIGRLDGSQ